MENPYAGEWSRISEIADEVREARQRVSELEAEARELQLQAQNIPAQMDENGNDMSASLRESMNAQAQDALQQLQTAREDLRESVSSAHSLARRYSQKRREYEEKERKTAKAGADFGKLTGFRFGSSIAVEAQRLAKQREKHYSDHAKALSSLISAAEQAAEGVDPNQQNASEIADRGTFQRPGNKSGAGRNAAGAGATKVSVRSDTSSRTGSGKSERNTGGSSNADLQSGDASLIQLAASALASPELLKSYAKDWNLPLPDSNETDSVNEKINKKYLYAGVNYKNPDMENYKYNQVVNPGPLSRYKNERGEIVDITTSFYGGRYNEETLQEDTIFYRVGSGDGRGHWFTSNPPDSIIQARLNNAIPHVWTDAEGNFNGFSEIDTVYAFVVPQGTKVYSGPVRDQAGMSAGGPESIQTFIPNIDNIRLYEKNQFNSDSIIQLNKNKISSQTESSSLKFGSFDMSRIEDTNDYFVQGRNYQQFIKDFYNSGELKYESLRNKEIIKTVSPDSIEGIRLGDREASDNTIFWRQHDTEGTIDSFVEIAKNIPRVQRLLDDGYSLDRIREYPELEKCVNIYFEPSSIPTVVQCNGYYEFDINGRHRILAAREAGYDIPVKIVGIRKKNI